MNFLYSAKELFPGRNGGSGDTEREFAVESKHLQERLSVQEIEQREIVDDPLKAVPGLPFGHLHQAWAKFLADLPEEAEVWSFSAQWENRWGQKELREGYVAMRDGSPDIP